LQDVVAIGELGEPREFVGILAESLGKQSTEIRIDAERPTGVRRSFHGKSLIPLDNRRSDSPELDISGVYISSSSARLRSRRALLLATALWYPRGRDIRDAQLIMIA
jgi:hypothetical protein